ncbi:MAG: carboxypeptidase regulatory-like domain-containing protein, partial [Gemmatimonadales bacterium]
AGYVAVDADSQTMIFYAPGLDAVESPLFVQDHCFTVRSSPDSALIGVAFQPTPARRRVPEVRGTIWLDRHSAALREMEFEYANVPRDVAGRAHGTMRFAALRNGEWVIWSWAIQMPVLSAARPPTIERSSSSMVQERLPVAAIQESGGVLSVVRRGADTLWIHPSTMIAGIVRDSATGRAVPAAVVEAKGGSRARSDASGRFTMGGLTPGMVSLTVRTLALDSLGATVSVNAVVLDSMSTVTVRLPSTARLAAARAARPGALIGVVVADSGTDPVAGAEIAVPDLGLATHADEHGRFRLDRIPPGDHRLVVRQLGFAPLNQPLAFASNTDVNRTIHLYRAVRLDSVIVEASAIPELDEDRKLGIGHFITRDALAKRATSHLSEILETIPSLKIVRSKTGDMRAFIARSRGQLSVFATGAQDAGGTCYASVYVDGKAVYGKIGVVDQEPFDINSISPDDIESIEYFAGPSETPARYSGLNSVCGVVVIWRRRSS